MPCWPLLFWLCLHGCGGSSVGWQRPEPRASEGELPLLDVARSTGEWLLWPDYAGADFSVEEVDGSRRLIASGLRIVRHADGSIEHSADYTTVDSARALSLPPRLGGGALFVGERNGETLLWRAQNWTSPLVPLARVSERVEDIVVGFDRLYLELPLGPSWEAIDLADGKVLDLEPLPPAPGYSSMAFADGWFGAVSSDVLGVLVTFDAGASWHELPGVDRRATVSAERGDLVLTTDERQLRLTPDGTLRQKASTSGAELFAELSEARFGPAREREEMRSLPWQPPLPSALRDAVLYGWPTRDGHALFMANGALGRVRLEDGHLDRFEANVYSGDEPCAAVKLGQGIGFVCNQSPVGTTLFRFVAPFAVEPVRRFQDARLVRSSGNGALVVSGGCDEDARAPGPTYCLIRRQGDLETLRVRGDAGVERIAILSDGSVAVLVPPRLGNDGVLTLIREGSQTTVPLALPRADAAFLQTGLWLEPLVEVKKGVLGTWVSGARAYRGVNIDASGKVTSFAPAEGASTSRTVFNGGIALEVTPSGLAFTTTNFGRDWSELEAPPALYPLDQRTALSTLGPEPSVGCSHVGCAYGAWLRVGFGIVDGSQQTKRARPARAPRALVEAAVPERAQFNPVSYFDWHPTCHATGRAGPGPADLQQRLGRLASERPRRGLVTGFLPPLVVAPAEGFSEAVFRPFEGMKGPLVGKAALRFDQGHDGDRGFRAYAWTPSVAEWSSQSAWQVWVQDPFGHDGVWVTAPTHTPWPDALAAADLFGARERDRASADWTLHLDSEDEGGILRIGSASSAELHVLGRDRATQSFGSAPGGQLAGAAKVEGQWYYGQHDGEEFRLFSLAASGPTLVAALRISSLARASVVKTDDGSRLGILVRTRAGNWFLYPLDDSFRPQFPLEVTREALNAPPAACAPDDSGWTAIAPLPLTRLDGAPDASLIQFEPTLPGWRSGRVLGKVRIKDGGVCLMELAADLVRGGEREAAPMRSQDLASGTIPLALRDPVSKRQLFFRCSLRADR